MSKSHLIRLKSTCPSLLMKVALIAILLIAMFTVVLYAWVDFDINERLGTLETSLNTVTSSNSSIQEYTYSVYIDGDYYCAKNGITGLVDYRSRNASDVINNAINNARNGVVLIRKGTYIITAPINIHEHIQLWGEGIGATILQLHDGANCNLLQYVSSENSVFAEIAYMTLNGNNGFNDVGSGIYIAPKGDGTLWDLSLRELFIIWFADCGIETTQTWGYSFFHIVSEYNSVAGMRIAGGSSCHVSNSKFMLNDGNGVSVVGGGFVDFESTDFRLNGKNGLYINGTACELDGCHIVGNSRSDYNMSSGIQIGRGGSNTRIISCEFNGLNKEEYGLHISDKFVVGTVVIGNTFYGQLTAPMFTSDANVFVHYNGGFITEKSGLTPSCVNGTWIAHGLYAAPNGRCDLTIEESRYVNATCYLLDPTIIAENSTHVQIEFVCINNGAIAPVGKIESRSISWYFEYKP